MKARPLLHRYTSSATYNVLEFKGPRLRYLDTEVSASDAGGRSTRWRQAPKPLRSAFRMDSGRWRSSSRGLGCSYTAIHSAVARLHLIGVGNKAPSCTHGVGRIKKRKKKKKILLPCGGQDTTAVFLRQAAANLEHNFKAHRPMGNQIYDISPKSRALREVFSRRRSLRTTRAAETTHRQRQHNPHDHCAQVP